MKLDDEKFIQLYFDGKDPNQASVEYLLEKHCGSSISKLSLPAGYNENVLIVIGLKCPHLMELSLDAGYFNDEALGQLFTRLNNLETIKMTNLAAGMTIENLSISALAQGSELPNNFQQVNIPI